MNKEGFKRAKDSVKVEPHEALSILRKKQGLSQNELSEITGISQAHISSMENGRIKIGKERAIVLAKALRVHPSVILFSDVDPVEFVEAA